jgi:hypothetical protein
MRGLKFWWAIISMQRKISIASLHYNEKNLFAQGIGKIIFAAAAHRNFGGSTFALLPAPSKPSEMRFLRPAQGFGWLAPNFSRPPARRAAAFGYQRSRHASAVGSDQYSE